MRGAILTTVLLSVALAQVAAAAPRTFVRSTGSDVNPCSLAAPCRNFAAAIAAVDAGGEVVVLDSAGYGVFTINKAVTVVAPRGVYAGISGASGTALAVAAGATDVVVVRGLSLNGVGAATRI